MKKARETPVHAGVLALPLAMEDITAPRAEVPPAPAALDPIVVAIVSALRGIERARKTADEERTPLPVAA